MTEQRNLAVERRDYEGYSSAVKSLHGLDKALVWLREGRKLTLEQIAHGMGYRHRSQALSIEAGNPTAENLGRFLDAMGADAHDLANALDVVNGRQTDIDRQVAEHFPDKSPEYRRELARTLERLASLERAVSKERKRR